MISVALTFKNRADFLDKHLHYLVNYMDYDMKQVEIAITDGYSTDDVMNVIDKWYKHFYQIKYAHSDRSVLPFVIPSNNPACDINALIANVVSFEKIIKTDPEVLAPPNSFKLADKYLEEDKDIMLWMQNIYHFPQDTVYNWKASRTDTPETGPLSEGGLWHCFNKTAFMEMKGIEEKFALGFGYDDMHFRYLWEQKKKFILLPPEQGLAYHFPHGYELPSEENMRLMQTYSAPILTHMAHNGIKANIDNPNWQRPEMIKDVQIFKDNERKEGMITNGAIDSKDWVGLASSCHSVIEIGCGECNNLKLISAPVRIGIEGFRPLIEDHKNTENYKGIIPMCLDLHKIDEVFVDKSIDCILGIDIIEHFTMDEALALLQKCENIAKKYVMYLIPVGEHPQMFDDRGYGNEMNFHRSTWYPEDMEKLGYTVTYMEHYYNAMVLAQGKTQGCMYAYKELS
jgi:hypothetical protein